MIIKKLLTWLFFHKHESKASNLENPAENTILAKDALGIHGEKLAAEFLKSKGFKIIGERVHIGMDELDLIAIDLQDCYYSLLDVLGKRVQDGIIDSIFSKFCLGK